jgi:capsular polysaccharide transport system permease protein
MFWVVVILPTFVSTIYFGLIASDIYISESQFVVRSPKSSASVTGLGAILQSAGFARSSDDTYTVHAYMRSRDAMNGLNQNQSLAQHYGNKAIDMVSRYNVFGFSDTVEELYEYFQQKLTIDLDTASSISTLRIKAYTPEQAKQYNEQLLQMGEDLINQLNARGRQDIIGYAQGELQKAEQKTAETAKALNDYRIKNSIFDVKEQAQMQGQLVSKLQDELIAVKTQLSQVEAVTPDNPQIPALKAREASVRKEINNEMAKILGGGSSIANKTADYERLTLEHKLAQQQLTSAMTSLDNANTEVQKKQLYLERIVQPNTPDMASEPKRLHNILATLILALISYGILKLLISSIKEHQQG